jgi:hypothetical protein
MNVNPEQQKAIESGEPVTVDVGGTQCVLVRKDIYLALATEYDARPWTLEEMNLLADEAEEIISREEPHEH